MLFWLRSWICKFCLLIGFFLGLVSCLWIESDSLFSVMLVVDVELLVIIVLIVFVLNFGDEVVIV